MSMINLKRIFTTLALSGVAALGVSGLAAASALAKPTFKTATGVNETVSSTATGVSTLETIANATVANKRKVECKKSTDAGTVEPASNRVNVTVTFTECEAPALKASCQSGAKGGEIVTKKLTAVPVYLSEAETAAGGVGLAFTSTETLFAEFHCTSFQTLKVKGSLVCPITGLINKMSKTATLTCNQTKGVQEYTGYYAGKMLVHDFLETEGKGLENFAFEQSGEQTTDTITSTNGVEIEA